MRPQALKGSLHEIDNKLQIISSRRARMADQDAAERKSVPEQLDSIMQSLRTFVEASHAVNNPRTNVFEEVSATEDAHQVVVSTNEDLVSAKQLTASGRARQWLGQMHDDSLQLLTQAQGIDLADRATTDNAVEAETERAANFDQYGAGYRLEDGGV